MINIYFKLFIVNQTVIIKTVIFKYKLAKNTMFCTLKSWSNQIKY